MMAVQARLTVLPPRFVPIVTITFLMWTGSSIITPTLPLYAESLGISATGVGVAVGAYFLGRMASNVAGSALADAWGLRSVGVIGCSISGAASFAAGLTETFVPLVVARVAQGAGAGLYATAALSAVVALAPADRVGRLTATYQGLGLAGFSVGPIIGGLVGSWYGLRAPFFAFAALAGVAVVLAVLRLPSGLRPSRLREGVAETATTGPRGAGGLRALLHNYPYVVALVSTFAFFTIRGGVRNSLVPLFAASELGLAAIGIGTVLAVASVCNVAVLGHAGLALDRSGRRPVLLWALIGSGASTIALAFVSSGWALAIVMMALSAATGYGQVAPTAITADVAPSAVRGSAIGVQRTLTDFGLMVGPAITGLIADLHGYRTAFAAVGAVTGALAYLAYRMPETLQESDHP